jgi:hypothetical protein
MFGWHRASLDLSVSSGTRRPPKSAAVDTFGVWIARSLAPAQQSDRTGIAVDLDRVPDLWALFRMNGAEGHCEPHGIEAHAVRVHTATRRELVP